MLRGCDHIYATDQRMLVGARLKIRSEFCQNAHVTNQGAVTELIKVGEDAIKVLRHSVIQAVATDQVDPDTGKQIYRYIFITLISEKLASVPAGMQCQL